MTIGARADEYAQRVAKELRARFNRYRGGESSSLAYRTVHWRKLKPAYPYLAWHAAQEKSASNARSGSDAISAAARWCATAARSSSGNAETADVCSADRSTHTKSNKLYRKVKHRYRPNLSPRQRPTAKARPDQAALAASAEARGATHRARPRSPSSLLCVAAWVPFCLSTEFVAKTGVGTTGIFLCSNGCECMP